MLFNISIWPLSPYLVVLWKIGIYNKPTTIGFDYEPWYFLFPKRYHLKNRKEKLESESTYAYLEGFINYSNSFLRRLHLKTRSVLYMYIVKNNSRDLWHCAEKFLKPWFVLHSVSEHEEITWLLFDQLVSKGVSPWRNNVVLKHLACSLDSKYFLTSIENLEKLFCTMYTN